MENTLKIYNDDNNELMMEILYDTESNIPLYTKSYQYDNDTINSIDSLGKKTNISYKGDMKIETEVDEKGNKIEVSVYQKDNVIYTLNYLNNTIILFEYDSNGHMVKSICKDSNTEMIKTKMSYRYDSEGRVKEVKTYESHDLPNNTLKLKLKEVYEYSTNGSIIKRTINPDIHNEFIQVIDKQEHIQAHNYVNVYVY